MLKLPLLESFQLLGQDGNVRPTFYPGTLTLKHVSNNLKLLAICDIACQFNVTVRSQTIETLKVCKVISNQLLLY